ncbi:dimethylhistidine N-methyltransferase [Hydrogenophaga crassostreae]|uniref:Dimethylhistidine N-methyltransferase n=1 Tax=Hydrogenophaga crassostreae TaxID=1763535 RepID=A0A162PBS5_9BURK|nr:L-histidine N(alpha)-methyltransferase [Hydrogenophaga crassostreae]AOW14407.1 dimethylhistidine N-methyltransferase [Hydrogenophaga crassostreae]OAD43568.1 dimethylhistidine N-methyltransferase [Hydrogenophaga crassostreae]
MHLNPSASPTFVQVHLEDTGAVQAELVAGLIGTGARIAPKFLYDALGSRLFDAITELPEYYPTRTEASIFAQHGQAMASRVAPGSVLIDLGAGSCAKAAGLFPVLNPGGYVAVDISVDYLREALGTLQDRHPDLPMLGLGQDFSKTFALPDAARTWLSGRKLARAPRTVFYPGSSIGNFSPEEALDLLRQARVVCQSGGAGGGVLIGVDLVKPAGLLEPAYDDSLGVTAAFNRNLLLNVNRWLGADFQPAEWAHVAFFDAELSRIEMHLQARAALTVRWTGGERRFAEGERIHTENAWKWRAEDFSALLQEAGFGPASHWTDASSWFGVFWAPAAS